MRRVRGLVVGTILGRAREGDDARIRRPCKVIEIQTVILIEDGELMRGRMWFAEPEVVMAFGIFYPGDAVANGRGRELGRIRRAEHLLKRERLLCDESPGSAEEEHESPGRAGPDSHARMVAGRNADNTAKEARANPEVTSC